MKTCEYTIDTINIVPQLTKHLFTSAAPFEKPYKLFSFMEIKINVLPGEGFARVCIFVCVCVCECMCVVETSQGGEWQCGRCVRMLQSHCVGTVRLSERVFMCIWVACVSLRC